MKKIELDHNKSLDIIIQKLTDKGINTQQLAKILNISYQGSWKYFRKKNFPSLQHLFIISKVLDCKIDDLLVGEPSLN